MRLADWLKQQGRKPVDFGRAMGMAEPRNVYRHMLAPDHKSFRRPSPERMRMIVELTGGAVTPNDFYAMPGGAAEAGPIEEAA